LNTCISCELALPIGVTQCPACGADQIVAHAKVDEARCSVHQEVQAKGTRKRCGRFMCVECSIVDAGVCRNCVELVYRDTRAQFESITVRLGWLAVVQGATATAIAWKGRELFWILSGIAAFSIVFGLVTVARKELWIVSLIACGLIAFISFFALFDTPLLIVCVALGLLEWRLVAKYTPLERETWLLRK
jgi:hypothetical protein